MRKVKEVKWRRRCELCDDIKPAWLEVTVRREDDDKHIICEKCISTLLSMKYWGIEVHRIAKKWEFPEWIIDKIKEHVK
jgi:hypothetical protein